MQVSRRVAAAPDTVWAMVADVTRMGEWSPETTACRWKGGSAGPAVGARFQGTNVNEGRRWRTTNQVTVCEPGRRFTFETTAGPLRVARWDYRFEPDGDGCLVTEAWTDQRGRLARWAGGPVSGVGERASHSRRTMEQTLERLAAAV